MDISQLTSATSSNNENINSNNMYENFKLELNETKENETKDNNKIENNKMEYNEEFGLDDNEETIKIIFKINDIINTTTKNVVKLDMPKKLIKISKLLNTAFENDKDAKEIELSIYDNLIIKNNKSEYYMNKILEYITYHNKIKFSEIEKPVKYTLKEAGVIEWDIKFLNIEDTEEYDKVKNNDLENIQDLFNLLYIANYLIIDPLIELLAASISFICKGKKEEELSLLMKTVFNK